MDRYAIRIRNDVDGANETYTFERNGTLKQIVLAVMGEDFDALTDEARISVELNPRALAANTGATEAYTATIASVYMSQDFLTSGGGGLYQALVVPLNEKISIGDRLRIYCGVSGGGNVSVELIAYIS